MVAGPGGAAQCARDTSGGAHVRSPMRSTVAARDMMADWPSLDPDWSPEWPYEPYACAVSPFYQEKAASHCLSPQAQQLRPPPATLTLLLSPRSQPYADYALPRGENPRELRNKAEKQRRDKLNKSISQLASLVPPVASVNRKFDKTSVLRLTAHYLRAYQYVFGGALGRPPEEPDLKPAAVQTVLGLLDGFLLTTTYRGLVVVVSQNIQQYLGYNEVDLLGKNIYKVIHPDDVQMFKDQLMPKPHLLGPHGELLIPNESEGMQKVIDELSKEKRKFVVRFRRFSPRSEPAQYVSCYVEGSMRKSDAVCQGYNRCCQVVRRTRARGDNPYSSGNDIVFIGLVRPMSESFISERNMESFKMEYRTRHSIDGEIIQCEQRIALVTGYMTHEVNGLNAMNFMHRDDVRWVIVALRQMYDQNIVVGDSCYRLMAKNGQFIYMKTRGWLDVEDESRAVRSFVCTNTVIDEEEGKHLIKMMKRKYMRMVNSADGPLPDEEAKDEASDSQVVLVEDPRNLEPVILHLVTNLPSPAAPRSESPECGSPPGLPLAIIPPERTRIVSAIERIHSLIKSFKSRTMDRQVENEQHPSSSTESLPETLTDLPNTPPPTFDDSSYAVLSYTVPEIYRPDFLPLWGQSNVVRPNPTGHQDWQTVNQQQYPYAQLYLQPRPQLHGEVGTMSTYTPLPGHNYPATGSASSSPDVQRVFVRRHAEVNQSVPALPLVEGEQTTAASRPAKNDDPGHAGPSKRRAPSSPPPATSMEHYFNDNASFTRSGEETGPSRIKKQKSDCSTSEPSSDVNIDLKEFIVQYSANIDDSSLNLELLNRLAAKEGLLSDTTDVTIIDDEGAVTTAPGPPNISHD